MPNCANQQNPLVVGSANANGAVTVNIGYSTNTYTACYYGAYSSPAIACVNFIPDLSQSIIVEYQSTGFITNQG